MFEIEKYLIKDLSSVYKLICFKNLRLLFATSYFYFRFELINI